MSITIDECNSRIEMASESIAISVSDDFPREVDQTINDLVKEQSMHCDHICENVDAKITDEEMAKDRSTSIVNCNQVTDEIICHELVTVTDGQIVELKIDVSNVLEKMRIQALQYNKNYNNVLDKGRKEVSEKEFTDKVCDYNTSEQDQQDRVKIIISRNEELDLTAFTVEKENTEKNHDDGEVNDFLITDDSEEICIVLPSDVCEKGPKEDTQHLGFDQFETHGESVSNCEPSHVCTKCNKVFEESRNLALHMRVHVKEKLHGCDNCKKRFHRRYDLKMHQKVHTGLRPFVCDQCNKTFIHSRNLTLHMKIHVREKYACEDCGRAFTELIKLKKHKHVHTNEEKSAQLCSPKKRSMKRKGERSYACGTCGKAFKQGCELKKHTRIHTGEKPYTCNTCGKSYRQSSYLSTHKRIHTGERPHQCHYCGSNFISASTLAKHTRIHTGEKPYACDICDMRFNSSSHRRRHTRVHTGEKLFNCDICGKNFGQSGNLKEHKRIHTGEKAFACDTCGQRFARSRILKEHKRIHNDENQLYLEHFINTQELIETGK